MTTGTEVAQALRFSQVVTRMLADPDLTGDLLLLGIALYNEIGRPHTKERSWLTAVIETTGLGVRSNQGAWKVAHLIKQDVPRYDPRFGHDYPTCDAPMIRREGPCGLSASTTFGDINPNTGERWSTGRCSRHSHDRAWQLSSREHFRQWEANGKPVPPHNAGGILARHLPLLDWEQFYAWAAPDLERTPGTGKPPIEPPAPRFTLIRGGLA